MSLVHQLAALPADRVVQLRGAPTDTIAATATGELDGLAAVVLHPGAARTPGAFVHAVLDELERVAVALLPGWLPEAADIHRADPFGLAAVRAAAVSRARGSAHYAPFLAHLAAVALSGRRPPVDPFSLEIRCPGLTRVVAEGFGRDRASLLIEVPAGLDAGGEQAVVAGAEWLCHHGRTGVWLVGTPLRHEDRVVCVRVTRGANDHPRPVPAVPPEVVGRPHPGSAVEAALEAALAAQSWAAGRVWNQYHQSHPLSPPVCLDLLWPDARCVVEIDGPEHCRPARFEADRQRDVQLQLDGYAVLRFTNARINHDVGAVVHQIGTLIRARRRDLAEGTIHARR
ncbi:endonuclease domain-containing protein [Micromonospora sp. NPDC051925]|uniref:endonuclease domain-containing protein n=1 Tax=Micromonospora sp. NPDC051925 TaxID=3364288 RepID=UPI0037C7810F